MSVRVRTSAGLITAVIGSLVLSACSGAPANVDNNQSPTAGLVETTAPGTKSVDQVTWAVYRQIQSLNPIVAFDYPENSAISLMCESLIRQNPAGEIVDGLASLSQPDPTQMVFDLKPGVTFWDGTPMTTADVVYSLTRAADPNAGGYYSQVFENVTSIAASGTDQVTLTLSKPDSWLKGELASMPGVVLEQAFTEKQGSEYGNIDGGTMCTGAYKLGSWNTTDGVTAVPNTNYWDKSVSPKVGKIVLKPVADTNTTVSGLLSGALDGAYASGPIPNIAQLKSSGTVNVIQGPAQQSDLLVIANSTGLLGNVKVRQALSLALDREGIIKSVYGGAATLPRWISNTGTFGYSKSTFDAAYAKAPEMKQDIAKAKQVMAGVDTSGKTVTIATIPSNPGFSATASAYQSAGKQLGIDVEIKSYSQENYINLFTDPTARSSVDAFLSVNYGDWADPASLLRTISLPGANQNYDSFNDPQLTNLLMKARDTTDDNARAELMVQASNRAAEVLPWIPNVQPTNVMILNKRLSGATASFSYMFAPWANSLGGVG